jgi:selenoprotein W-related protein
MVDQLLGEFEHSLDSITLIPSSGGVYEVIVGDDLVYSKKETGRHAEYEEVAEPIRGKVGGGGQATVNLLGSD